MLFPVYEAYVYRPIAKANYGNVTASTEKTWSTLRFFDSVFKLPDPQIYGIHSADLPYEPDAIKPHIDERTMRIHCGKQYQGYTNNLNPAIEGTLRA